MDELYKQLIIKTSKSIVIALGMTFLVWLIILYIYPKVQYHKMELLILLGFIFSILTMILTFIIT